jgi:hypothetical protein
VTSEDATALFHLLCLWHGAYAISVTDGIWAARRCDNSTRILTADTAPGTALAAARRPQPATAHRNLNHGRIAHRHAAQRRRHGNCNISVTAGGT